MFQLKRMKRFRFVKALGFSKLTHALELSIKPMLRIGQPYKQQGLTDDTIEIEKTA